MGRVTQQHLRTGNLLVITPGDYAGSAPLSEYVAARTAAGFQVTTMEVASGVSRSTIKSNIDLLWGTPDAPKYILLIGDTAGSSSTGDTIPNWTGGGSKGSDTDMYYGTFAPGIEWYPDVPVGRFSVSSLTELQTIVDKTLFVEAGNFPNPDYMKRGAFLANPSTYGQAEPTHDAVITNYFDPIGYEGIRLYAAQGAGTQDVINEINTGCLFVTYFGHSSDSGWWDPSFRQDNIAQLNNAGLYGVGLAWSCNTAHYTYDECFGETWIRTPNKGGVAYISASDYIYWGSVQAWAPSVSLEQAFYFAVLEKGIWELGPAWRMGLYGFLKDFGGWDGNPAHEPAQNQDICRNFFEEFVILGDPSLLLPQPGGGADLRVTPFNDLVSEGPSGGPFTPEYKTYTLTNNAEVPISFTVSVDQDWIDIDQPAGTIPVGSDTSVTVTINSLAEYFADGYYEANIDFINTTTHDGDTTRAVTLDVGVPVPVIVFNLDTDPGWTTEGEWAWGQPTGNGGEHGNPDPTSGYTGDNVYGYNLNGDYTNSMVETHLTSMPLDCSYLTNVGLKFQRWLGVEQPTYDHAYVRVSNDGANWVEIWNNGSTIEDSSWTVKDFDISDVADGEPTVYLRWTMGSTDTAWLYCGWNIDDIELWATVAEPECARYDIDNNGFVGGGDINLIKANYGPCAGGACEAFDIDGNGFVGGGDINLIKANYGPCP